MNELFFSSNAVISGSRAKSILGVFFDGSNAICMWNDQGKSRKLVFDMEYDRAEDMTFAPSLLDTQCMEEVTYNNVFRKLFLKLYKGLLKEFPKKNLLVAFLIPERGGWTRYIETFHEYLEELFRSIETRWSFVLIPMKTVVEGFLTDKRSLFISVEREWTDFYLRKSDNTFVKTSAHIGVSETSNPKLPISIRMNDYLNDSTYEWDELSASNLMEAYACVLSSLLSKGSWEKPSKIIVSCPESIQNEFSVLMNQQGYKVTYKFDLPLRAIDTVQQIVRSRSDQTSKESKYRNERKQQTNKKNDPFEDPFNW